MSRRQTMSLTYGRLPDWPTFSAWFDQEVGEGLGYRISLGRSDSEAAEGTSIGDGGYGAKDLYRGLQELVAKFNQGNDAAGDLASSILSTLGFEWI